jgi:hypothetical protein
MQDSGVRENLNTRLNSILERPPLGLKPWHRIIKTGGRRSEIDDKGNDMWIDLRLSASNSTHVRRMRGSSSHSIR